MSRRDLWLLLAAIAIALVPRIPTIAQPLLEKHPFRQTWTAYTALTYHEQGIDLFNPQLPVFGEPFFHPQEFPVFQALAAIVMRLGVATDEAMRITALLCFFATAVLLFGLARHVAGRAAAWATFLFFVASPFALVWSRASLIEYLATAACVAWIWSGIRFREERTWGLLIVALLAGSLGALVKPTTAAFCVMPIALYRLHGESADIRTWLRTRLDPRVIALLVVPGLLAIAWTTMADAYFRSKPEAAFLAPSNLRDYFLDLSFGRLDGFTWGVIWSRFAFLLIGVTFIPLLGVAIIAARRRRTAFWTGVALAIALPILVFYGGYRHHDYYIAALSPHFALLLGLGAAWLFNGAARRGRRALVALFAGAALAFAITFAATSDYWPPIYEAVHDSEDVLPAARELAALSRSDDLVVMIGRGWDPDVLYYARRRGLMLTGENATRELVESLPSKRYRIFFSWDPAVDPIALLRFWTWSGAVGPRTYEVGADARALERSAVLATDDRAAFDAAAAGARRLASSAIEMPCDGIRRELVADPLGVWLVLRADAAARISFDALEGPLPVRPIYVITPAAIRAGRSLSVSCIGAGSMTIDALIAAPPPQR